MRLVLVALLATVPFAAGAANQTVLGNMLRVKDPSTPANRRITVRAREVDTDDTIVGDPSTEGATVAIVVHGNTPTNQTYDLPPGQSPLTGRFFWSGDPERGFTYRDRLGENGPVKSAQIKLSSGTFQIKVEVDGAHGAVDVVPPNPGTDGCVLFSLNQGDSYSVQFSGGLMTSDAHRFQVAHPTTPRPLRLDDRVLGRLEHCGRVADAGDATVVPIRSGGLPTPPRWHAGRVGRLRCRRSGRSAWPIHRLRAG
jgi:hypothetical protein